MPAKRRRRQRHKKPKQHRADYADDQSTETTDLIQTTSCTCLVCHGQDKRMVTLSSCNHSVCEQCLLNLVKENGKLDCPQCNGVSLSSSKQVVIGKVKNLYLSTTNSEKTDPTAPKCSVHSDRSVEFLCLKCNTHICLSCKLAEHEGHEAKSIGFQAAEARQRLTEASTTRLRAYKDRLQNALGEINDRKETLCERQKQMEKIIRKRHEKLQKVIDKHRDSALLELEAIIIDVECSLDQDEVQVKDELSVLSSLLQRIEHSIGESDPSNLFSVDKEVEAEWSGNAITIRRSRVLPSHGHKIQHIFSSVDVSTGPVDNAYLMSSDNNLNDQIDRFIGHSVPSKTVLPKMTLDVTVEPQFCCCEDPEAFVLSVCPTGAEKLAVSYTTSSDLGEGVTKSFFLDGRPSKSFDYGLCTLQSNGNGCFFPITYKTSQKLWMIFRLLSSKSGNKRVLLCSESQPVWSLVSYFTLPSPFCKIFGGGILNGLSGQEINYISSPFAFDITDNGTALAFVDAVCSADPLVSNLRSNDRVVKMIVWINDHWLARVYKAPDPDFLPSDVCFFTLQGQTVLLVSDMGTSSIHVVSVRPGHDGQDMCKFQRYLVADCDFLKQPTALNTDETGRLWVACKGGQLLTVTPAQ